MIFISLSLAKLSTMLLFAAGACTRHGFLFLPSWYEYLDTTTDALGACAVKFSFPNDLLAIGLAILDILLRIAGFAAVVSIIIAGGQHLFTGGNPEKAANARRRLFNSLMGLALAFSAIALVTFVGRRLG